MKVYPTPGFVMATPTMCPPLTAAVPINSIVEDPALEMATATFTIVCIPDLYPDPLFPILID